MGKDDHTAELARLYPVLAPRLRRVCSTIVGESEVADTVQEVFLALHRALPRFRGESSVETWAYRVAIRVAHRHRIRRSRHELDPMPDSVYASEDQEGRADLDNRLRRALAGLSSEQRTLLTLITMEGLPSKTVAEILGVAEGTIWSRLNRARAQLAELLEDPTPRG